MISPRLLSHSDAILDRWAKGHTSSAIAKAYATTAARIHDIIKRARRKNDVRAIKHETWTTGSWTDEKMAVLRRLVAERRSALSIANSLGVTRNAVIGKCHRLGLQLRGAPVKRELSERVVRVRQRRHPTKPQAFKPRFSVFTGQAIGSGTWAKTPIPEPVKAPDTKPVSLMDIGKHQCRYIIGEPIGPQTLFCGAPTDRHSLCAFHAQLCWTLRRKTLEQALAA